MTRIKIGYYYENFGLEYTKEFRLRDERTGFVNYWYPETNGAIPTIAVYEDGEYTNQTGDLIKEVEDFIFEECGFVVEEGFVYAFHYLKGATPQRPVIQTISNAIKSNFLDYELVFLEELNEVDSKYVKHPVDPEMFFKSYIGEDYFGIEFIEDSTGRVGECFMQGKGLGKEIKDILDSKDTVEWVPSAITSTDFFETNVYFVNSKISEKHLTSIACIYDSLYHTNNEISANERSKSFMKWLSGNVIHKPNLSYTQIDETANWCDVNEIGDLQEFKIASAREWKVTWES